MPKQKTPLMELIEELTQKAKECYEWGNIDTDGDAYMECVNLIKSKLPTERKMVEDAIIDNADIRYDHFGQEKEQASTYFTNKYGE